MTRTLLIAALTAQAALALSIRDMNMVTASMAQTLDASTFVGETDLPLANATFWINTNGTLQADASAKTTTANEWVNPFPMSTCYGYKLEEATIDQMQDWMASGKLSSRQLVMCYHSRIAQLNEYTKAVVEINPDGLYIADQADAERAKGKVRGPLHGIPFLVKDNIATLDRMETTAGSLAMLGSRVPRDAHVVKLLREKGAVLMGKTNMECAWFRTFYTSNGYSSRFGQTRNAYNLTSSPGGSSSGSGVAVAANMCAFSLGTETDSSVIRPARRHSIFGIKTTLGLTSRAGVVPQSVHQDTVGVHARTFRDAALALGGCAGIDSRDNYTEAQSGQTPADYDYAQFIKPKEYLKGVTLGLPWASIWNSILPEADGLTGLLDIVEQLKAAGATIINGTEIANITDGGPLSSYAPENVSYYDSIQYRSDIDMKVNLEDYLSTITNTNIKNLSDVIEYNLLYTGVMGGVPGTVQGFLTGQDGFDQAIVNAVGGYNSTFLDANARLYELAQKAVDGAHYYTTADGETKRVDALLTPSAGLATTPGAVAGWPMITVPAGISSYNNVPYGISLIGVAWTEPKLIAIGSAIDDLIKKRELPKFYEYWSQNLPIADTMT